PPPRGTYSTYTLSLHDALPISAHKALAKAATDLVHGPSATAEALRASEILFGGGLDGISEGTFNEIVGEVPTKEIEKARLDGTGDRKSTRLNSSHQIISYAVFC